MLQSIEKTDHEASDITASIRDLPSVKLVNKLNETRNLNNLICI
jgi:hypothetical protein